MMLEHLGHGNVHDAMLAAIEKTLADRASRTADLGGSSDTTGCGDAIVAALES